MNLQSLKSALPRLVFVLALSSLALVAGCSNDTPNAAAPAAGESAPAAGETAAASGSEANLDTEKWNAYVSVINQMNDKYFSIVETYLVAFGDGEKVAQPEDENDRRNFTNAALNLDEMITAVDQALEISAKSPTEMDKLAAELAKPLKELLPKIKTLTEYYRNKEYVDDKYAKAEELHPQIVGQFGAIDAAFGNLEKAITAQEKMRQADDLKQLKADGREISATALEIFIAASKVQEYLIGVAGGGKTEVNAEELRKVYGEMAPLLAQYEKLKTQEQSEKEGLFHGGVENYLEVAKDYKALVAALIEKQEAGEMKPEYFHNQLDKIFRGYDLLVSRYNSYIAK